MSVLTALSLQENQIPHVQWNLSIKDTLNKGLLSKEDTVCSPNHIDLCTNVPLNQGLLYRTASWVTMVSSIERFHRTYSPMAQFSVQCRCTCVCMHISFVYDAHYRPRRPAPRLGDPRTSAVLPTRADSLTGKNRAARQDNWYIVRLCTMRKYAVFSWTAVPIAYLSTLRVKEEVTVLIHQP